MNNSETLLDPPPDRDELASQYLEQLPFTPYPVQEEALLTWFTSDEGVLVCAPTGTGKTLIAEAALFEALHTGTIAYYTTPLIALSEQKFREIQQSAVRWGFQEDDIGLVTGSRRVNPQARVLVVVAEILMNRLLHSSASVGDRLTQVPGANVVGDEPSDALSEAPAFDFSQVTAVVMDEFHSFADPERGIVWELTLALLPPHVRLLLLSATVGNAGEFLNWLRQSHKRRLELVESSERHVPLVYRWIPDELLNEQLQVMAAGDEPDRRTPALVFCFNREECWTVAEQLKGKDLLASGQQKILVQELDQYDWSKGVGPKLRRILMRGVGVHHAGILPRYKQIVESLFQRKLLTICVCTETLSAGMNLPARSVVITTLLKGPFGKKKVIDASTAHQIFGRAGRPQFDDKGYVFALAHEDDVKIGRWREKYDAIPEDSKDPNIRRAKKAMKKKMPTRRKNEQYWNEAQFQKLVEAPPGQLASRGALPWRLLAHLLQNSPDVSRIQQVLQRRLMDSRRREQAEEELRSMLLTLWTGGYVTLYPEPVLAEDDDGTNDSGDPQQIRIVGQSRRSTSASLQFFLDEANVRRAEKKAADEAAGTGSTDGGDSSREMPIRAVATDSLSRLLMFRSVNPLYGVFLTDLLGQADRDERVQAFESVLDLTATMQKSLRVPDRTDLPPGPLATGYLDAELLQRGLATEAEITGQLPNDEDNDSSDYDREFAPWPLTLGEKLRRLFDADLGGVHSLRTRSVWAAGELLRFGGDFNTLVTTRKLSKQEGLLFRHVLRLILLLDEFRQLIPIDVSPADWQADLDDLRRELTAACRTVDPDSTDKFLDEQRSDTAGPNEVVC